MHACIWRQLPCTVRVSWQLIVTNPVKWSQEFCGPALSREALWFHLGQNWCQASKNTSGGSLSYLIRFNFSRQPPCKAGSDFTWKKIKKIKSYRERKSRIKLQNNSFRARAFFSPSSLRARERSKTIEWIKADAISIAAAPLPIYDLASTLYVRQLT